MNKLLVIVVLLNFAFAKAQTYSSKIIPNNTMLLKGYVGKYPITMYVERVGYCEYEQEFTGWYKYDKSAESIPILFYYSVYPEEESFKIYAKYDGDFETEVDDEYVCQVLSYDEVFESTTDTGLFADLTWQKAGSTKTLDVKFNGNPQQMLWSLGDQNVYLTYDDKEVLDIGALGYEYAYEIDILGHKTVDGVTHLLISIIEPSKPGSAGRGMCGAGDEIYILYLQLDDQFKLIYSDAEKEQSCFQYLEESPVEYDIAFPEKGFTRLN